MFGSVKALIWAAVVQGGLQTAVLWWYLQSRFGAFWRRLDGRLMRSQLSYAVPLGLAGILYTVQTDLHSYFVSNRLGAVAYAIYGVGTVQLPLITMLQEATNAVVIPRVSALQLQNDTREIIQLMARAMRKLAAGRSRRMGSRRERPNCMADDRRCPQMTVESRFSEIVISYSYINARNALLKLSLPTMRERREKLAQTCLRLGRACVRRSWSGT